MLSSRYISEAIPAELWDRYSAMEMDMILAFAKRARDMDYTALWYADKLRALGILREDLQAVISRNWTGTRKELAETLERAGFKSLSADEKSYQRGVEAGILRPAPPMAESVALRRILETGYRQALNKLNVVNTTAVGMTVDALDKAYTYAVTGFKSLQTAVEEAVNELATRGITGATFPSGRSMELAPYVRMLVRTAVTRTTADMGFARAQEYGNDLIRISAHAGARPLCAPYQGKVYSLSGRHPKYPPFSSTSYGEPAGIFGINCGHYPLPFVEGLDKTPTAEQRDPALELGKSNVEVYEESQVQRYYERKIREWKHKAAALDEAGIDSAKARAKVAEWQTRQRLFVARTGRTRRYEREKAA